MNCERFRIDLRELAVRAVRQHQRLALRYGSGESVDSEGEEKSPTLKKRAWGTLICLRLFRPGHPSGGRFG
jgi:hypothetical protein